MLKHLEPKIREILDREPRGFFNDEVKELQLFGLKFKGYTLGFDDATFILKNFVRSDESRPLQRRRKDHA